MNPATVSTGDNLNIDIQNDNFYFRLYVYDTDDNIADTIRLDCGEYDLVVVGGGMAGCCTAVTAARLGCRVALIQNRPVLGGNNSSEVRVGLSGLIHLEPYPKLGNVVDELGPIGHWTLWEAERDPESERSKKILDIKNNLQEN